MSQEEKKQGPGREDEITEGGREAGGTEREPFPNPLPIDPDSRRNRSGQRDPDRKGDDRRSGGDPGDRGPT